MSGGYWIGFDVGGTFVDLFAHDTATGRFVVLKVPSAREGLAGAIVLGLRRLLDEHRIPLAALRRIAHGTTVVTNQLVERTGARVGVVATRGFRDVIEIGRMRRPSLYDLYRDKVPPLAPRDMRLEVSERVAADGTVLRPLALDEVRAVVEELIRRGAEAVAVCFLNAYANPVHEQAVGALCRAAGVPCSLSAEVSGAYGEFERWTTTVVNSYVMPRTTRYLGELLSALRGMAVAPALEIMQSNGGVVSVETARAFPVHLVVSGPAAGVSGATVVARAAGLTNLITLDMGGTSTDIGLVVDGRPVAGVGYTVEGYPLQMVGLDIRSIGAGGGSIAAVDRMGALQVGPASAGADPGPAAYGTGGTEPTVTDADLVLGYLNPRRFCNGERPLDPALARQAVQRAVASRFGVSVEAAALGIVRVAVTNMVGAVRTVTTERGYDPRDFVLVAFGGAGPVHAGLIARELNIPEILVPHQPGLLSAKGLLLTDYRTDAHRTMVGRLAEVDLAAVNRALEELEARCRDRLRHARGAAGWTRTCVLELCYEGQQHVIPVPVEAPLTLEGAAGAARRLDAAFRETYGFLPRHRVAQLVGLRVTVEGTVPRVPIAPPAAAAGRAEPVGEREAVFDDAARPVRVPVYDRDHLPVGARLEGPCIVEEAYSTTIIYPGQRARVDAQGNIRITVGGGHAAGEVPEGAALHV